MDTAADAPGWSIVRADAGATALFVVTLAVALPLRDRRPAQFAVAGVSMVLFAAGIVAALLAYSAALERSRREEVGVANLYLLSATTAPGRVRRWMLVLLALQVAAALGGAIAGSVGLGKGRLNALAFGVLVPMLGIGLNGLWAARHGSFGPRLDRGDKVLPTNKKIG